MSLVDCYNAVEELKSKKFFVQHVETVSSSEVAVDILQSFVASKVIFDYFSSYGRMCLCDQLYHCLSSVMYLFVGCSYCFLFVKQPDSTDALETKTKHEDQRRSNKTDNVSFLPLSCIQRCAFCMLHMCMILVM